MTNRLHLTRALPHYFKSFPPPWYGGMYLLGSETSSSTTAASDELEERLLTPHSPDCEKPNVRLFAISDSVIEATEIVQTQGNSNGFSCKGNEFFVLPLKVFLLMMSCLFCGLLMSSYEPGSSSFNLRSHFAAFTDLKVKPVKHRREILFYGDSLVQNLKAYDDILGDIKSKLEKLVRSKKGVELF